MTPRHALYVGWVLGTARWYDLAVEPIIDDAGDYTDRLRLTLDTDRVPSIEIIVPPPPDDWKLNGPGA